MTITEPTVAVEEFTPPTPMDSLRAHRGYAERVRLAADAVPTGPHDELRARVATEARAVRNLADRPMTIGVVGEYSAGKSMLLGLLLGNPALLPVGVDATTANVTALRLLPAADDLRRAEIERAEIDYLTSADLDECVVHMLGELARLAVEAGIAESDVVALGTLPSGAGRWAPLERWCRAVGWPSADPELRPAVRELMRLRDAATGGVAFLGVRGKSFAAAEFRQALLLPAATVDPDAFPEPRPPAVDLDAVPAGMIAAHFRATLPLIERVTLDVRVPQAAWNLSALRGHNELMLLDFPGLDARISGIRDRYLCRRELRDVHAILVLLNALGGGRKGPSAFRKMMQRPNEELRDAVLVGIGRFDQLPNTIPGDLLADRHGSPDALTERRLDAVLGTVLEAARELVGPGHDERIAFTSSMVALDMLEVREPGTVHYDATFAADGDLAKKVPEARAAAAAWKQIGHRLAADEPGSKLSRSLMAFGADGGVTALRELLESHVVQYGVRQRLALVRDRAVALDGLREQLAGQVRGTAVPSSSPREKERTGVRQLVGAVSRELGRQAVRARSELPDPRLIRVSPTTTLAAAVQRRATEIVFDWPQWSRLFQAVGDNGDIAPHKPADDLLAELLGPMPTDGGSLPVQAEGFLADFVAACSACDTFALQLAWTAFDDWIRRADAELAPLRTLRATLVDDDAQARVAARPDSASYAQLLGKGIDLSWMPSALKGITPDGGTDDAGRTHFPLRPGSAFAWDPDAPESVRSAGTLARHQVRAARLRREFANAVARYVLDRLGTLQLTVAKNSGTAFAGISGRLTGNQDNLSAYVDAVVGAGNGMVPPAADPAAHLADIALPPVPSSEG